MYTQQKQSNHTSKVSMAADTASAHPPEPYNKANEHENYTKTNQLMNYLLNRYLQLFQRF